MEQNELKACQLTKTKVKKISNVLLVFGKL
jgi:hypothetical protein